jgi:hypothetical protein
LNELLGIWLVGTPPYPAERPPGENRRKVRQRTEEE